MPYQKFVSYNKNNNDGVDTNNTDDCKEKVYIYNSTNASSKRSHYIIKKPVEGDVRYKIPPEIINSYNQNYKKNKYNSETIKEFYNIFTDYNKLIQHKSINVEGLIVFFVPDEDKGNEVSMIGRTPYFKIPYQHSLRKITGNKEEKLIDYADAIFGFICNEANESKLAYKSRVRFSAIDIKGNINKENEEFLLTTPSATACAMYLEQKGERLSTYEDMHPPKLNGYKYYRVLEKAQSATIPEDSSKVKNMISKKEVIRVGNGSNTMEGKIYFNNLKSSELGLLLLSLDIGKLSASSEYKDKLDKLGININDTHEQIGGAKPYGYGAVKVAINEVHIEKNDNSFETLIGNNLAKSNASEELDYTSCIDDFLEEMLNHHKDYFEYLKPYIESKQIKSSNSGYEDYNLLGLI